jgi:mono/diheme cytochrome c family protein
MINASQRQIVRGLARLTAPLACAALLVGCHQDMWNQPRYTALQPSKFFTDGRASRPIPAGTVQFGRADIITDSHLYKGKVGDAYATDLPAGMVADEAFLLHGQQRYQIYCTPCHGYTGDANGFIVARGFKQPTSYHDDRLKGMPIGYFVDVMTNGFGTMYSYASRVTPEDRWAIAAYIRVLQSTHVPFSELSPEDQAKVNDPNKTLPVEESHEGHGEH